MADLEMFAEQLVEYSIVYSQEDADDLFEDIKHLIAKQDFKKAAQSVYDYELDVYGFGEEELPYGVEGYEACLKEIYEEFPYDESDIKEYDLNEDYIKKLANDMVESGILDDLELAFKTARIIREYMQMGKISAATDIVIGASPLPRHHVVLKLGNIAARLHFLGENDSELD